MEKSLRLKLNASFGLALAILAGIQLLSHFNNRMLLESERWVEHTLEVVKVVEAIQLLAVETQSGSRGYVITGEERYLEPYHAARDRLPPAVQALRQLTADNPNQQRRCDRLEQLVSSHVVWLARIITERRTRGAAAAASLVEAGPGKALLDSMRALLADMHREEMELLAQRNREAESANAKATLISWAGVLISTALFIAVFYFLRQEIGRRSRAETELRESWALLQSILDSMGDGIVSANRQGQFTLFNPAAEQILGQGASRVSPDQWTEQYRVYLPDGVTPYPADQLPLARALRGESVDHAEMRIRRPGEASGLRWLSVTARPIRSADGNLAGGVAVFGDATESKQAEEEIRLLNRQLEERVTELGVSNRELEAFSYSVSHDLRAPLRQVHGFAKVVCEQYSAQLDAQAQHYLGRIEEGAAHMGRLIDDLLNLARLGRRELRREPTGLSELEGEVSATLEAESNERQIEWRLQPLPRADCDRGLIKQVFANLLSNSLKYTRPRQRAVIEVGQAAQDGEPVIYVRDNGVGFNMKYADKLFGVFQRLHRSDEFEGMGVGLATVQRIIHKHGGRIWAESEVDQGATFCFTLGASTQTESQPRLVEERAI